MYPRPIWKIALPGALMFLLGAIAFAGADEGKKSSEATPLSKSVTLHFEIAGAGQSVSITTATSAYRLHSEGSKSTEDGLEASEEVGTDPEATEGGKTASSEVTTESEIELEGSVAIDDETGLVLITCAGSIRDSKDTEDEAEGTESESRVETTIKFDASTRIKPGEQKLLVQSGPFSVKLSIEVAE